MAAERIGKLERWILIYAYKKTVLNDLPEDWKRSRYFKDMPKDNTSDSVYNDKSFNVLTKPEIMLNYFHLQISYRKRPVTSFREFVRIGYLSEKFVDNREYKTASASYSRTRRNMEIKNLIEEMTFIEEVIENPYEMNNRRVKHDMDRQYIDTIILTDKGKKEAERLLKVNSC